MGLHQDELKEGLRDIITFSPGDSLFCYRSRALIQKRPFVRQTITGYPVTNIAKDIVVKANLPKIISETLMPY